jgi:hypothetical protein
MLNRSVLSPRMQNRDRGCPLVTTATWNSGVAILVGCREVDSEARECRSVTVDGDESDVVRSGHHDAFQG